MSARFELAAFATVSLAHGFYADGRCADLRFSPTPATDQLLRRRRLRFRAERDGFGLFAPVVRPLPPPQPPAPDVALDPGARLVFAVTVASSAFLGVTDLPYSSPPGQVYLLRRRPGQTRLSAAATVTGADRVRLAGSALRVPLNAADAGHTLSVLAPDGRTLHARAIPPLSEPPELPVDLTGFQGGLVSVRVDGVEREPVLVDDDLLAARPFAVIELAADPAEVWPLTQPVNGTPALAPMALTAAFGARQSVWRYHVLRRPPAGGAGDTFGVRLDGAARAPYPAGVQFPGVNVDEVTAGYPDLEIFSFASTVPLPCFERPLPKLVLENVVGAKTFRLADNLPNPPRAFIKPDPAVPNGFVSDVFLHL